MGWKDDTIGEVLISKHESLILITQNPHLKIWVGLWLFVSQHWGCGDRRISGTHWPVSLACLEVQISEIPCLKYQSEWLLKVWQPRLSSGFHIHAHTFPSVHTYTKKNIQINELIKNDIGISFYVLKVDNSSLNQILEIAVGLGI